MVSIVTVNYHQPEVTYDLLRSLERVSYPCLEIILVDNGVGDRRTYFTGELPPRTRLLVSEENLGFAGGTNKGIRVAGGDYILLLNNDTIVPAGFLEPMVELMETHPRIGMVSPKIYFHDQPNVLQFAGATAIHPLTGRGNKIGFQQIDDGSFEGTGPAPLGNGACMLVRRQVFEEIGLLSELYFMYYEEHDFCERAASRGWETYYTSRSYIHHRQSMSLGKLNPLKTYFLTRNRLLYMRRRYRGLAFYSFLLYYLLVGMPRSIFRHLMRGEFAHSQSVFRGLIWNLSNHHIQYHHEAIDL